MKLFKLSFLAAAVVAAGEPKVVTEFCGQDLNDFYGTDANDVVWMKKEKKDYSNADKPKKQAHWRQVVRIKCASAGARRPGNKPGGYPVNKVSPIVKCVPKGPAGADKLKPNGRRGKSGDPSKPAQYAASMCT